MKRHTIVLPKELSERVEKTGNVSGQIQASLTTLHYLYERAEVTQIFTTLELDTMAAVLSKAIMDGVPVEKRLVFVQSQLLAPGALNERTRNKVAHMGDVETLALYNHMEIRIAEVQQDLKKRMFRDVLRQAKVQQGVEEEEDPVSGLSAAVESYLSGRMPEGRVR